MNGYYLQRFLVFFHIIAAGWMAMLLVAKYFWYIFLILLQYAIFGKLKENTFLKTTQYIIKLLKESKSLDFLFDSFHLFTNTTIG